MAGVQYIVIGSANINQRSMDGSRDSEIAVGGFQPYHVAAPDLPRGDVRPCPAACIATSLSQHQRQWRSQRARTWYLHCLASQSGSALEAVLLHALQDAATGRQTALSGAMASSTLHTSAPAAQVHGFRMALWEEHTGIIHPSFYEPASMECVLQLRSIGQTNWEVRRSAFGACAGLLQRVSTAAVIYRKSVFLRPSLVS